MPSPVALFAIVLLAFSVAPHPSAAAPFVSEVMPNTSDDANLEYFSISDSACVPVPLAGYRIVDASGKAFAFPSDSPASIFPSGRRFYRPETKISLNNDVETLFLYDVAGTLVDSFSYSGSQKGVPVIRPFSIPACISAPTDPGIPPAPSGEASLPPTPTVSDGGGEASMADPETFLPAEPITPYEYPPDAAGDSDVGNPSETASEGEGAFSDATNVPDASDSSVPIAGVADPTSFSGTDGTAGGTGTAEASFLSSVTDSREPAPDEADAVQDSGTASSLPSSDVFPSLSVPSPPLFPPSPSAVLPAPASPSSRALPETLALVDSDGDARFDSVRISYSEALSGSASPEDFLLYSDTGGLFPNRVPTLAWYFSRVEILGNVLSLSFSGNTLPKYSAPRVDASTSSVFRIKSGASGLLTRASGLPAVPLALTTSFSGYSRDRVTFEPAYAPFDPLAAGQGSVSDRSSESDSDPPSGNSPALPAPPPVAAPSAIRTDSATGSAGDSRPPVPPAPDFVIVPSAGVDLLPDGKYRFDCQSSTSCPVSFRVEGLPPKAKGHWEFSDGRKRFGTSTTVLGRGSPARYLLSYVLVTKSGPVRFPVEVSVRPAPSESVAAVRTVRALGSEVSPLKSSARKSPSSPTGAATSKKSAKSPNSPKSERTRLPSWSGSGSGGTPPSVPAAEGSGLPVQAASAGAVALFVGLMLGGWFFNSRKAWLPEETP